METLNEQILFDLELEHISVTYTAEKITLQKNYYFVSGNYTTLKLIAEWNRNFPVLKKDQSLKNVLIKIRIHAQAYF